MRFAVSDRVATVVLDHPPLNVFDPAMQDDLEDVLGLLEAGEGVRVIVIESAHAEFFVAHYDVGAILAEDTGTVRTASGVFNRLMSRLRTGSSVTIAKIRGAARGGGCELALACDLRFAAAERARFGFPEVALGILAAGGGTQRLPALIGRPRALEMLLGCGDVTADEAERYQLVNRTLPDAELDGFVMALARRIAAHPADAVAMTKLAVGVAEPEPREAGFALEAMLLDSLKSSSSTRRRLARFLELGAQTESGEADFASLLARLADDR
jgi:enoyl-CoA hydratase/carnithine racemase